MRAAPATPRPAVLAAVLCVSALVAACGTGSVELSAPVTSPSPPSPAADADAPPVYSAPAPPVESASPDPAPASDPTPTPEPSVTVGTEVLADSGFAMLDGQRVGLIANQTSLARGEHLIDLLDEAPNVELTAVFAPEHGVRGAVGDRLIEDDRVDLATGVTIFSLYSETRRPTPEMLEQVDVLVFDLQDVGTRFYTFISTLGLAMQSAADAGIPFVVLDRPNPIGGRISSGFTLEPDQVSFIGQYPIPSAYGLTSGELALAIRGEGWLPGLDGLDIRVVEMDGWTRDMLWPDTGRAWVPPSPGLPTFDSALAYPGAVLFEATSISYGAGTLEPFAIFGASWADGDALESDLDGRGLPGVDFRAVTFRPRPIEGVTENPRLNGERMNGVAYDVTDPVAFEPVATGVHVLDAFNRQAEAHGITDFIDRPPTFDLLAGTTRLREMLDAGTPADQIVAAWTATAENFVELRDPYLLY